MKSPLHGRRALVTGASAGIGAATARALAGAGAEVWLVARRAERLQELARELPKAHALSLDVADAAAAERELADLPIDLLVDNAGLALGVEKLSAGDPAEWSRVIDTNVKGVLNVTRALLPGMLRRGHGDVVLIGSVAGRQVYPGGGVYCASKHAVRAIYEALRLENLGSGLRFLTLDPGMVGSTEFSQIRMRGDAAKAAAVYQGVDALTPEDIAEALLWAVTRPAHVNVGELVIWASAQASTTQVHRRPG
ncbi:MAG: SDR family NAD(P)-dependent oxidoreductase [Planctomycetes bacterium]|nr:SDR family NAD(P)-dependent oxidoreductase [Planctomycetota bacterium]